MSATAVGEARIYQLKITLRHIRPAIMRRVLVPGDFSLAELHDVIQLAMGWTNSHLHQFEVHGVRYGMDVHEDAAWGIESEDERKFALQEVAPEAKARFTYEYDFGDDWLHDILVEKILPPEPGRRYPVCLAGKRAAPLEDSGGPYGYEDFLEALRDPQHPDHEELVDWAGKDYDPERFDLEEVNARLARLRKRHRRGIPADAGTQTNLAEALAALKVPAAVRPRATAILEISDRFPAEHLDEEYAHAARRVVAVLARKRPSPLLQGEPRGWAAAVLHVVVTTNALFETVPESVSALQQLTDVSGLTVDELFHRAQAVLEMVSRRPLDAVLTRNQELFRDLGFWMADVEAGLADPEAPPPSLRTLVERMTYLAEQAESAREAADRSRPSEDRPHLRLLKSPPSEEEEEQP